ncbi:hypothetical protein [Embleya sp. NPDC059259]|uniref:hypothetical protein n=1 Tax=unclassified Embleya TaxID=2699296 RepID=UPI0036A49542
MSGEGAHRHSGVVVLRAQGRTRDAVGTEFLHAQPRAGFRLPGEVRRRASFGLGRQVQDAARVGLFQHVQDHASRPGGGDEFTDDGFRYITVGERQSTGVPTIDRRGQVRAVRMRVVGESTQIEHGRRRRVALVGQQCHVRISAQSCGGDAHVEHCRADGDVHGPAVGIGEWDGTCPVHVHRDPATVPRGSEEPRLTVVE